MNSYSFRRSTFSSFSCGLFYDFKKFPAHPGAKSKNSVQGQMYFIYKRKIFNKYRFFLIIKLRVMSINQLIQLHYDVINKNLKFDFLLKDLGFNLSYHEQLI